jgi:TRAP-type C4-dicarboxylate transport system permease small subunit
VARRWARALSSLLTLVFCGFLAYATIVQAGHALKVMEKTGTALNWPIPVYLKTLFAVCAVVMTLQTLLHLARDVAVLRDRAGGA